MLYAACVHHVSMRCAASTPSANGSLIEALTWIRVHDPILEETQYTDKRDP
jgi:hypothetical protein